jgi:hypothetical protein
MVTMRSQRFGRQTTDVGVVLDDHDRSHNEQAIDCLKEP